MWEIEAGHLLQIRLWGLWCEPRMSEPLSFIGLISLTHPEGYRGSLDRNRWQERCLGCVCIPRD